MTPAPPTPAWPTAGLAHCRPEFIEDQARIVFGGIKADNYLRDMDHATVADRLAYHWGETTTLHPFRDGNTRTQRLFFHQLTTEAGWSIDWHAINAEMDQFKHARLIAHAGNHGPLRDVLAPELHPAGNQPTVGGVAGPGLEAQIQQLRSTAFPQPSKEATQKRPTTSSLRRPPPSVGRHGRQDPGLERYMRTSRNK